MINSSLTPRHNTYCGVPADEQIERSRFSEKVPLSRIAANLFQRRQRCRILYPFGEHQNAEVFADANERFDDAPCLGAVAHAGDEHPVDLQLIERKQKQRLQAGGAHTEVVDREPDAQPAQGRQQMFRGRTERAVGIAQDGGKLGRGDRADIGADFALDRTVAGHALEDDAAIVVGRI